MKYSKIKKAAFVDRPNRFVTHVTVDGKEETVHVKNTGRCKELLTPNATVILEESSNPNRKTKYSLIAVYKGDKLIKQDYGAVLLQVVLHSIALESSCQFFTKYCI